MPPAIAEGWAILRRTERLVITSRQQQSRGLVRKVEGLGRERLKAGPAQLEISSRRSPVVRGPIAPMTANTMIIAPAMNRNTPVVP